MFSDDLVLLDGLLSEIMDYTDLSSRNRGKLFPGDFKSKVDVLVTKKLEGRSAEEILANIYPYISKNRKNSVPLTL